MTRYFFDSRDDGHFLRDEVGLEFPDLATAQVEAARALAEIAVEIIPGSQQRTLIIEVHAGGATIFTTRLVFEMVAMEGEPDQYGREQSNARH